MDMGPSAANSENGDEEGDSVDFVGLVFQSLPAANIEVEERSGCVCHQHDALMGVGGKSSSVVPEDAWNLLAEDA